GLITATGMPGWASRTRSRKPETCGAKDRSLNEPPLWMLMPRHIEMTSAGCAAIACSTIGSRWHWPDMPRQTRSQPRLVATIAGQVSLGPAAALHWLIEEP